MLRRRVSRQCSGWGKGCDWVVLWVVDEADSAPISWAWFCRDKVGDADEAGWLLAFASEAFRITVDKPKKGEKSCEW